MRFTVLIVTLIAMSLKGYSQMDVKQFKKFQFGVMYDKTNVTGLYTLTNPNTNEMQVNLKDYRTTTNMEIKVFQSNENGIVTANFEGFLYILGRLISLAKKSDLFYDFDTPLDPLSAGNCHNVKFISGDQYNEVAKLSNNHLFDITASKAIKQGPAFVGVNMSLRTLGFAPRYTVYKTEIPSGLYASCSMAGTWKVLYGLHAGYRTNLGGKAALFVIGGLNTGLNKGKNSNDQSTAIQVKYSPFINPTLFIGGKMGMYLGVYWEMMEGRDKNVSLDLAMANPGAPTPSQSTFSTKVNESQVLLKLGFYFSAKHEEK